MSEIPSQESLYFSLFNRAVNITTRSMKYLSTSRIKETAHDITIDFLFFSNSYRRVYDIHRGQILPFFASYVRLKLRGIWESFNEELTVRNVDDVNGARQLVAKHWPDVETWVEWKQCVTKLYGLVRGKTCSGVPVDSVLKAGLFLHADEGGLSVASVCEQLGTTNKKGVRDSLKLIQRLLIYNLGVCDEPHFYSERRPKRVFRKSNGSGKVGGNGTEV